MGSGKSKLGPLLARRCGRPFEDLDAAIERAENTSILELFDRSGQESFREVETRILERVVETEQPTVIALGGGAFLSEVNRALLRDSGTSVWLDVPVAILASRLARKSHRPMLLNDDGSMPQGRALQDRVEELLDARRDTYAQADIRFEVRGSETPRANADRLFETLQQIGAL